MTSIFEPVLADLGERQRDEILAAFAAVENSPEPVPEAVAPGLRDATLRRSVSELLHLIGRTLVRAGPGQWTSGYRDDVVAQLTADGGNPLPLADRAVLTLVLIHSVAIPRSRGTLAGDRWTSGQPTMASELLEASRLAPTDVRIALGHLRAAGLVQLAPQRVGTGQSAAYLPGPQLHRLSAAARRRLQEELILAAGPDTPLAAAIRRRRAPGASTVASIVASTERTTQ